MSSTRFSSKTSPFTRTAPGLKTELIGYGQWAAVRIGLPSKRVNSSEASFARFSGVMVAFLAL
jgi:hypothetical protein